MPVIYYATCSQSDFIVSELPWQRAGLSYTASGYGVKIPTRYTVKYAGRVRRVYCTICSNVGSLFVVVKGRKEFIR